VKGRIELGWLRIFLFWKRKRKGNPTRKETLVLEYLSLLRELEVSISVEERMIANIEHHSKGGNAKYLQYHKKRLIILKETILPNVKGMFHHINGKSEDFDFYEENVLSLRTAQIFRSMINIHF